MLTDLESRYCENIIRKVSDLREFLKTSALGEPSDVFAWYGFLSKMKAIQGNLNNDISFIATVLSKLFLENRFGAIGFDAAKKPQSAPGLDIDTTTPSGERIVAEIKTTVPHKVRDFGAQQKQMMEKDFKKLHDAGAEYKFMFVTEKSTFEILCRPNYATKLVGVEIVDVLLNDIFAA